MSNDLISRKAAYKAFSDYLKRNFAGEISSQTELNIGEIASVIKSIPTAFDKEKVIGDLEKNAKAAREYWHKDDREDMHVLFRAYKNAAYIVKMGGLN